MRVFANEKRIRRGRRFAQITFLVTLLIVVGSFLISYAIGGRSEEEQLGLSLLSAVILPIGLVTVITSVRQTNQWMRLPRPEEVLNEGLKGLGNHYTLYHYYLPTRHVLFAPRGVFSITVRFQSGNFVLKNGKLRAKGGFIARIVRFLRQEHLGNPIKEAQHEATDTQAWLDAIMPESGVTVEPIVAFIAPGATFEAEAPPVPVVYADAKRKPNLYQYVTQLVQDKARPQLTKAQRRAIQDAIIAQDA